MTDNAILLDAINDKPEDNTTNLDFWNFNLLMLVGNKTCHVKRTELLNFNTCVLLWNFLHYFERLNNSKLQWGENCCRKIKKNCKRDLSWMV